MKSLGISFVTLIFLSSSVIGVTYNKEKTSLSVSYDGNTLYVGGSGPGNYSTIKSAILDASDGDTVFVYNGLYEEININIDKAIILRGEDKNNTIIDGNNDEYFDVLRLTKNGIQVNGFTVKRCGSSANGVHILSSNNKVRDCNLIDNHRRGLEIADDCHNNIVTHCEFLDNWWGLEIQGWDYYNYNNTISFCTFHPGNKLLLHKEKNTLITDCILYEEISFELPSDGTTILNCKFFDSHNAIYFGTPGIDITIENCTFTNIEYDGIYVYDPQINLSVRNCTFENCGSSGILFWSLVQDSEFYGNKFINNTFDGIIFTGGMKRVEITRCHIEGNDYGIHLGYINRLSKFSENNFINNNGTIVKGGLTMIFFCLNTYKNNYWDDWRGWGPYHVYGFLNWDLRPAKEPYDIRV